MAEARDGVRGLPEAGIPVPEPKIWFWGLGCIMLANCAGPVEGMDWDGAEEYGCVIEPMDRPGDEDAAPKLAGGDVVPCSALDGFVWGVGVPGSMIDPNWGWGWGCAVVGNGEDTSEGRVAVLIGGGC